MASSENYLGIDPGKSGAMAIVGPTGELVSLIRLKETHHDVWEWLDSHRDGVAFAVLEKVHSMPKQGVASSFKFGVSYGFCQGMLVAAGIRFDLVTPQKWQKTLGCMSRGDKNVTKARAQELFPGERVIHATADALLLAEYVRRIRRAEAI